MGKKKYLDEVRNFISSTPVFKSRDIEKIVGSKPYAQVILHILTKRGEVNRLLKDCYSVFSDPIYTVYCFKPSYIGLQEALSLHGLWEQEVVTVIVTARRVRIGLRKILNSNVLVRRISPRYFFGFKLIRYGDSYIPISDIEKTIIDMIYFNERIEESIYSEIKEHINIQKLNNYLTHYPSIIRSRIETILNKHLLVWF